MSLDWKLFYHTIRGSDWPDCEETLEFARLPENIKKEIIYNFNGLQYIISPEHSVNRLVEIIPIDSKYNFLIPKRCNNLIRVGNTFDGGYIIPEEMIMIANGLLSGGIGLDWEFEKHWSQLNSSTIHAYDATCTNVDYQKIYGNEYNQMWSDNRIIYEQFIGTNNVLLSHAIEKLSVSNIFVKLDIEGSEYECIEDIIKYKNNIIGMVIEFHEIGKTEQFISNIQLLQQYYDIVHIHANNSLKTPSSIGELPYVLEITLSRKDFIKDSPLRYNTYLVGLDSPNDCNKNDLFMYFN
jgi:hypothetical protein